MLSCLIPVPLLEQFHGHALHNSVCSMAQKNSRSLLCLAEDQIGEHTVQLHASSSKQTYARSICTHCHRPAPAASTDPCSRVADAAFYALYTTRTKAIYKTRTQPLTQFIDPEASHVSLNIKPVNLCLLVTVNEGNT
jgi:hypothetical protein